MSASSLPWVLSQGTGRDGLCGLIEAEMPAAWVERARILPDAALAAGFLPARLGRVRRAGAVLAAGRQGEGCRWRRAGRGTVVARLRLGCGSGRRWAGVGDPGSGSARRSGARPRIVRARPAPPPAVRREAVPIR